MGEARTQTPTPTTPTTAPAAAPATPVNGQTQCAWCEPAERCAPEDRCGTDVRLIVLLGNPNTGKTTLFNRLSGLRHKTSNFPGTTLEARVTRVKAGVEGGRDGDLIDLPGIYSLELDQLESRICREVLAGTAAPRGEPLGEPECAVVVVDAANLARNLMLVGEVFRRRLPTLVVVNMIDVAESHGMAVSAERLEASLGCGVALTNARDGDGIDRVRIGIREARIPTPLKPVPSDADQLRGWADEIHARAVRAAPGRGVLKETTSDKVDRVLLHPVGGTIVFGLVMAALFYTIFSVARYPMDVLDAIFGWGKGFLHQHLGSGALANLLADGVLGGVGSTLMFLPQICLLFFIISLLEDTGYLARGAFLMDRVLRPFGLPGHAFVPLLSSHACALPGIMATRGIPDRRERLATILVAPFMTCSARLPVYVLLTTLLFKDRPLMAALAFTGCYLLGILAAVVSALIARRTLLRGKSRAMALELPTYKRPSFRTALVGTSDRARMFLLNAGTNILVICVVLWWLGAYPRVAPADAAVQLQTEANAIAGRGPNNSRVLPVQIDPMLKPTGFLGVENRQSTVESFQKLASTERNARLREFYESQARWAASVPLTVAEMLAEAERLEARHQKTHSFLGTIGRTIEPVFRPLGFDWQLTIGVLASFAAREVFVSTMNVVIAGQEDKPADEQARQRLMEQIQQARRSDGVTPIFTPAASWSLLVFFVLAMQCLPTLAVTAKESGHVKWALLQLVWMTGVAYLAAMVVYQCLK